MGFNIGKFLGGVAKAAVNVVAKNTIGVTPFKNSPSGAGAPVGSQSPPSQPVAQPMYQAPTPSASEIAAQATRAALDTIKTTLAGETKSPAMPPMVGVAGIPTNMLLIGGGLLLVVVILFALQRR